MPKTEISDAEIDDWIDVNAPSTPSRAVNINSRFLYNVFMALKKERAWSKEARDALEFAHTGLFHSRKEQDINGTPKDYVTPALEAMDRVEAALKKRED